MRYKWGASLRVAIVTTGILIATNAYPQGEGFVTGTRITLANGKTKRIESIVAGDMVMAFDTRAQKLEPRKASGVSVASFSGQGDDYTIEISLSDGATIQSSNVQPFWVMGKGYASFRPDLTKKGLGLDVEQLARGDTLLKYEGNAIERVSLLSVARVNGSVRLYFLNNIPVDHDYFANGVLVHNPPLGPKSPPIITVTVSPSSGWYHSSTASFSWSRDPSEGGIVAIPYNIGYSINGGGFQSGNSVTVYQNCKIVFSCDYDDGTGGNPDEVYATVICYITNIDNTPPTVPVVSVTPNGWTNGSVAFIATSTDSQSGLREIQYMSGNGSWTSMPSGNQLTVTQDETVQFRAIDNLGNISGVVSGTAKIDTVAPTAPSLGFSGDPRAQAGEWTSNTTPSISFISTDDLSGIDHYTVSVDGGAAIVEKSPYALPSLANGLHTIKVTAYDIAGNYASATATAKIDNTAPTISALQTSFDGASKNLVVSWTATDADSGLASCSLGYSIGTAGGDVPVAVQAVGSAYTATIPLDALYGTTVSIVVTAIDQAQNTTSSSMPIEIPPQIGIKNMSLGVDANGYMEVDLDFGLSEAALQSFTALTVTRTQASAGSSTIALSNLTIDPSTIPSGISASSASPTTTPWELGANGDVIYADYIPVSSGAGHKAWTYTLSSAIYGASGTSWSGISPASGTVNLPNNQGTVSLTNANIVDMKGNPYGSSGFTVGATGEVQIEIQGSDPDEDSWGLEIDKISKVQAGSYSFTSYASLSGRTPVTYSYPYGTVLVPVNLSAGDNNIELVWTEGPDTTVEHSQVLDLVLKQSNGVYTLTVTDGYGNQVGGTGGGLTVAPWQPLQFSVSASNSSDTTGVTWVWGDGSPDSSGASATHAYQQAANQTKSFCSYQLTIELPGGTSIPLTVTVQDTQEGTLWGNEVWHGDHTVLGVVVVPPGMSLTIGSGTVSFQGDLGAGFGQGITVQGDLQVAGGVTLEPAAGQSQGWGTVLVEGTAEIGASGGSAVTIERADRGIAADAGSAVTLVNTTLMKNLTGIQVVGTQKVSITGCSITGNTVYGIKEDSGGRPTVTNTTIKGNFRDYYQWDGGLLTIMQINALGKNSGNQGE